uniref:C-type lectin domain-containing protein n=1 Tax=Heliothis virescens TaxID=7102 RepID=A0A2A4JEZ4_HELVI
MGAMLKFLNWFLLFLFFVSCSASYHEQYRDFDRVNGRIEDKLQRLSDRRKRAKTLLNCENRKRTSLVERRLNPDTPESILMPDGNIRVVLCQSNGTGVSCKPQQAPVRLPSKPIAKDDNNSQDFDRVNGRIEDKLQRLSDRRKRAKTLLNCENRKRTSLVERRLNPDTPESILMPDGNIRVVLCQSNGTGVSCKPQQAPVRLPSKPIAKDDNNSQVPIASSPRFESYMFNNKEYIVQLLPVNWENAKILCRGYHNGSLAVLDTRDKAEFLAEALSESQFSLTSVWVGARRDSAEDAAGYRWGPGMELRRTALDVLGNEEEENVARHYPLWLNRTHVPVPEMGADCVALERVGHDHPVFLDLPCHLERAFACERDAREVVRVTEVNTVRCRSGLYHLYDGKMDWHQAAAFCVLKGMALANIASLKCLRRLGMTMLKNRPSIENAWVGATGNLGHWKWIDTGISVFQSPALTDAAPNSWPPMRNKNNVKQNGCLQLDRHASHPPVFLESRCERKMQFICYEGIENAWVGATGNLGHWKWIDTGISVFQSPALTDAAPNSWPPMRNKNNVKQNGCLQLDRHASHPPVFLESRCERKMQFICYEGMASTFISVATPSDDQYYYVLVRQLFYWQHAYQNCLKMNGTLASLDNNDILIQLLLVMGENKEEPIEHIWVSGRLNMTKDVSTDTVHYAWYNPNGGKRIPDPKAMGDSKLGLYMPPWLEEDFSMDNSCLNLDRQDHLVGLVYGLACDTAQYSICMIEKSLPKPAIVPVPPLIAPVVVSESSATSTADGYESS